MSERLDWAGLGLRADAAHAAFIETLAELRRNLDELRQSASALADNARSTAIGGRVCGRTSRQILQSLAGPQNLWLLRVETPPLR